MRRRFLHSLKLAVISCFGMAAFGVSGLATAQTDQPNAKSEAAKSFEDILKQAGEQGFLQIEGQVQTSQNTASPRMPVNTSKLTCSVSDVFDLRSVQAVASFDDVLTQKGKLKTAEALSDITPLAKTYMALGMGAEVSSLVSGFSGSRARALDIAGRVIEGTLDAGDVEAFDSIADCNGIANFWALMARASEAKPLKTGDFKATGGQLQTLEDLPVHLQIVFAARLGIYAAENNNSALAEQLMAKIEPQTKHREVPMTKTDERLYLYALIRQLRGDEKSEQVFKHLAKFDGAYRSRALHVLADNNRHSAKRPYDGFSDDLMSVRQQYKGQAQGREATLEVVKYHVQEDQYIFAIELSKSEFSKTHPEFTQAVTMLAERIQQRLDEKERKMRLNALNGYMHDTEFFAGYKHIDQLKSSAYDSALDLNLPELALLISPRTKNAAKHEQQKHAYALASLKLKKGLYDQAITTAIQYKEEPIFQKLLLEAAVQSGERDKVISALKSIPDTPENLPYQAKIAWQDARWDEAKAKLKAQPKQEASAHVDEKIAIAEYVARGHDPKGKKAAPNTGKELDALKEKIDGDLEIVKAYLDNG